MRDKLQIIHFCDRSTDKGAKIMATMTSSQSWLLLGRRRANKLFPLDFERFIFCNARTFEIPAGSDGDLPQGPANARDLEKPTFEASRLGSVPNYRALIGSSNDNFHCSIPLFRKATHAPKGSAANRFKISNWGSSNLQELSSFKQVLAAGQPRT